MYFLEPFQNAAYINMPNQRFYEREFSGFLSAFIFNFSLSAQIMTSTEWEHIVWNITVLWPWCFLLVLFILIALHVKQHTSWQT